MGDERIEFIDQNYGKVSRGRPDRPIRMKKVSYETISNKYKEAKTEFLMSKLHLQQAITATENEIRARKIEQIIEQINILSLGDVPSNYASSRAIKLREEMMKRVVEHARLLYRLESNFDNIESEIFNNDFEASDKGVVDQIANEASEEIGDSSFNNYINPEIINSTGTNDGEFVIEPANWNLSEIRRKINDSFDRAENKEPYFDDGIYSDDSSVLGSGYVNLGDSANDDEVRRAIDAAFDRAGSVNSTEAVSFSDFFVPYNDKLSTVSESFSIDSPKRNDIEFNSSMRQNDIPGEQDAFKTAIREEVRNALGRYYRENNSTNKPIYNYKPMTDAEIAKAREEIGTSFNNTSSSNSFVPVSRIKKDSSNYNVNFNGPVLRDDIIVVPERGPINYSNVKARKPVSNYSSSDFDSNKYSIPQSIYNGTTSSGLEKLRGLSKKIETLQQMIKEARNEAIDAEKTFQNKEINSRKIKDDNDRKVETLVKYFSDQAVMLENSLTSFQNSIKLANEASEMADRYINEQVFRSAELDEEIAKFR